MNPEPGGGGWIHDEMRETPKQASCLNRSSHLLCTCWERLVPKCMWELYLSPGAAIQRPQVSSPLNLLHLLRWPGKASSALCPLPPSSPASCSHTESGSPQTHPEPLLQLSLFKSWLCGIPGYDLGFAFGLLEEGRGSRPLAVQGGVLETWAHLAQALLSCRSLKTLVKSLYLSGPPPPLCGMVLRTLPGL